MSLNIFSIEKALLTGKWSQSISDSNEHRVVNLVKTVVDGRFREALTSPLASPLFQLHSYDNVLDRPLDDLIDTSTHSAADETEGELLRLTLAVACLHAFVQTNWTGPDLDVKPLEVLVIPSEVSSSLTEDIINQKAISELAFGGEPAYPLTQFALFLRLAQLLMAPPYRHCQSAAWWKLRTILVHQQVLDEPVAVPPEVLTSLEPLTNIFSTEPELGGRLLLEQGLLQHHVSQDKLAAEYFVRAAKATGLEYELTGALGKRTKFQTTDLSQLVLLAESQLTEEPQNTAEHKLEPEPTTNTDDPVTRGAQVPETIALHDDTLLEQTEFTSSNRSTLDSRLSHIDPSSQPALHPLDQCILLALCLNVKNTSPSHGLTGEQMSPYISRVISHPRNWSVHTMALLLRSRLESSRTRTVERSTLQLQALVDQMPTADSSVTERLLYFHAIPLPNKWEMERELALRFLTIGVIKSALEIFERLEMWEEVVKCWGAMERPEKAIAIVRDLLEGRKSEADAVVSRGKASTIDRRQTLDIGREAKLWCLLGDLEPESAATHYERAWAVSKGTSGRAMRSLGGYYFGRGQYQNAISCLKRAVAINPLLTRSWFILGCACVRIEDWKEAKNAFGRCVAIDDEDGESWNNLASMYLRMGTEEKINENEDDEVDGKADETAKSIPFSNKILAFRALKQGLRFSYDNWRMWSNYMIVAMDVGELSEACRALGRVVEETSAKSGANAVDDDVLERLVDAVTRAPANPEETAECGNSASTAVNPNEGHGLLRNVLALFEQTILPRVSSPRIFRAYARLLTWQSRWEDALKASLDGYRCSTAGMMEKGETDVAKWREAVSEVEEITDVLRNFGPRVDGSKWRLQARSIVRTFMGRTKDFEDEPEWVRLTELQDELRKED